MISRFHCTKLLSRSVGGCATFARISEWDKTNNFKINESINKKGNAYKSSQFAEVFLGVTETIVVSLLAPYLEC